MHAHAAGMHCPRASVVPSLANFIPSFHSPPSPALHSHLCATSTGSSPTSTSSCPARAANSSASAAVGTKAPPAAPGVELPKAATEPPARGSRGSPASCAVEAGPVSSRSLMHSSSRAPACTRRGDTTMGRSLPSHRPLWCNHTSNLPPACPGRHACMHTCPPTCCGVRCWPPAAPPLPPPLRRWPRASWGESKMGESSTCCSSRRVTAAGMVATASPTASSASRRASFLRGREGKAARRMSASFHEL